MTRQNWILWGVAGWLGWQWYKQYTFVGPQPYPPSLPTGSGGVIAGPGSVNPFPGGILNAGETAPTGSGGVVASEWDNFL